LRAAASGARPSATSTVAAIGRDLERDGFVLRYLEKDDGGVGV
jgi:GH15 family glucan-1,4-alpha-glucosidase